MSGLRVEAFLGARPERACRVIPPPGRYRVKPVLSPSASYVYIVREIDGKRYAREEQSLRRSTWTESRGLELTERTSRGYTWEAA